MRNKLAKKIRRLAKEYWTDWENRTMELKFYDRFKIAMRIIFKRRNK